MSRNVRPWTDEEIGWLLDHSHLSARRAGEELGRGMQSVQHKRNQLRQGWTPEKEAWTEDEIDFVRATPNLTAKDVAAQLGRSCSAVTKRRMILARTEGLAFGDGSRKSPHEVGKRRLLAKTCLGCGILLDASWFSWGTDGKGKPKNWKPRCNRCHGKQGSKRGYSKSGARKDGGESARATYKKLQAITRERATRHGEPWIESDHIILRDPDLTNFEKAIRLGRTYAATHVAVSQNGYTSRVGRGDPMKGRWVIDNPNAPQPQGDAA